MPGVSAAPSQAGAQQDAHTSVSSRVLSSALLASVRVMSSCLQVASYRSSSSTVRLSTGTLKPYMLQGKVCRRATD